MSSPEIIHGPWFLTSTPALDQLLRTVNAFNALSEVLDIGGPELLKGSDYTELNEGLELLISAESVHPVDIRSSGLLEALLEITAEHSRWPFAVRRKARLLTESCETRFGRNFLVSHSQPITSPRSISNEDLAGAQGSKHERQHRHFLASAVSDQPKALRLLNLQQPLRYNNHQSGIERQGGRSFTPLSHQAISPTHSLRLRWTPSAGARPHLDPPKSPLRAGSLAFQVGKWWTGPVAAARDGIIEWPLAQPGFKGSVPRSTLEDPVTHSQKQGSSTADQQGHFFNDSPGSVRTSYKIDSRQSSSLTVPREHQHVEGNEISAITFDDSGAYAILFSGELEIVVSQASRTYFQAHPQDPGRKSLMKNLISQDPIRVLRSCYQSGPGLESNTEANAITARSLKPAAGVRYDGLYKITGYSVSAQEAGSGQWHYKYSLERLAEQINLDAILSVPSNALVKQALYEKVEWAGSTFSASNGTMGSLKRDTGEYWGITKRALELTPRREETIGTYARLQRNFASAAVEKLKRDGGL